METRKILAGLGIFIIAAAIGFSAGELTEKTSGEYQSKVSYTVNASNPIQKASFDNRTIELIVRPGKKASFYVGVNGTISEINGLVHDGDVREFRKIIAIKKKTYILYFRYSDDQNVTEDAWMTLYKVKEI